MVKSNRLDYTQIHYNKRGYNGISTNANSISMTSSERLLNKNKTFEKSRNILRKRVYLRQFQHGNNYSQFDGHLPRGKCFVSSICLFFWGKYVKVGNQSHHAKP